MNTTDRLATAYLKRIEELLADIGEDDRASLLADLAEQLSDVPGSEVTARLGTPEEFVEEYRRSAGIETPSEAARPESAIRLDTLISGLCLPFGIAILLSFGGQLLFGPFVLVIEWILARISPRPLRIFWSALAGLLAAEIIYLIVDMNGLPPGDCIADLAASDQDLHGIAAGVGDGCRHWPAVLPDDRPAAPDQAWGHAGAALPTRVRKAKRSVGPVRLFTEWQGLTLPI